MSESISVPTDNAGRKMNAPVRPIIVLALMIALLLGLTVSMTAPAAVGNRFGWFITGGFALVSIVLVMRATGLNWAMPPIMYMLVLWVFHFGLTFPAAVLPDIMERYTTDDPRWVYSLNGSSAIANSFTFFMAYALAVALFARQNPEADGTQPQQSFELIVLGRIVVLLSLGVAGMWLLENGIGVILAGYGEFFFVQSVLTWSAVMAATGVMFQIAGGSELKKIALYSLYVLLPLSAALLLGGARTAVFFPLAAIISLWYVRGLRLARWLVLIGALTNLTLIATIRETRSSGVDAILAQQQSGVELASATDALVELGSSLRPVYAAIDYTLRRGDYMYGETYIFPFVRQFERLFEARRSPTLDERFIALRVTGLYGAIGFSVVAEAFVNGGPIGVVLFAFVWGVLLSWLTTRATTPYGMAVLATVLIPMFVNVRNSFVFVPAWVLMALASVGITYLFFHPQARVRRGRRGRNRERADVGRPSRGGELSGG